MGVDEEEEGIGVDEVVGVGVVDVLSMGVDEEEEGIGVDDELGTGVDEDEECGEVLVEEMLGTVVVRTEIAIFAVVLSVELRFGAVFSVVFRAEELVCGVGVVVVEKEVGGGVDEVVVGTGVVEVVVMGLVVVEEEDVGAGCGRAHADALLLAFGA